MTGGFACGRERPSSVEDRWRWQTPMHAVMVLAGVVYCGHDWYLVRRDRCFRHLTDIDDGYMHATPVREAHCMCA